MKGVSAKGIWAGWLGALLALALTLAPPVGAEEARPKTWAEIVAERRAEAAARRAEAAAAREKARYARNFSRIMERQPPLAEEDVRIYLAHLEAILDLADSPHKADELAQTIEGWTADRFTYVTTKMAVGLAALQKPDDPAHQFIPPLARPTEGEMALIARHEAALSLAAQTIDARNYRARR